MLVKTLLNNVEKYSSFVYNKMYLGVQNFNDCLIAEVHHRVCNKEKCPVRFKSCSTCDTARKPRLFSYVSVWGFPVYFSYHPRRVQCKKHGVLKERITTTYKIFLGRWAKRLSWAAIA